MRPICLSPPPANGPSPAYLLRVTTKRIAPRAAEGGLARDSGRPLRTRGTRISGACSETMPSGCEMEVSRRVSAAGPNTVRDIMDDQSLTEEENVMLKLKPIGLYKDLSFTNLEQVVAALKMTETVNMDQLHEEFCARQEEIQKARQDTTKSTSEKWVAVFQNIGKANLINMFRIVPFVLSVPSSNAFVERIFSLMAIKWSDSRNSTQDAAQS
ncbi:uncharacterized protein LOC129704349 [Leucoraja erinacea]|uniref:uncharacterized protein LOC129704349 n=1 Tax=Leucoraja erinaceus TaxID=7782 RepID=UPI00245552EE|nr:uncharacterized protein LOC129704349 [Leucoraja erinacea]